MTYDDITTLAIRTVGFAVTIRGNYWVSVRRYDLPHKPTYSCRILAHWSRDQIQAKLKALKKRSQRRTS